MKNRDKLIKKVTSVWQDLLNHDEDAEEKVALLCKDEIQSRINDVHDDICEMIYISLVVEFYKAGPDAFVDGLDKEIIDILSKGKPPTIEKLCAKIFSSRTP